MIYTLQFEKAQVNTGTLKIDECLKTKITMIFLFYFHCVISGLLERLPLSVFLYLAHFFLICFVVCKYISFSVLPI